MRQPFAKKECTFDAIEKVLIGDHEDVIVEQIRIMSKKHCVYTATENKKALGYYDDKKYSEDGINMFPLGYYKNKLILYLKYF